MTVSDPPSHFNSSFHINTDHHLNSVRIRNPAHTLVVLGNGFDLLHGVKSAYADFRDWLMSRNPCLLSELESYVDSDSLWCDFEKALAHIRTAPCISSVDEGMKAFGAYDSESTAADFFMAAEFAAEPLRMLADELSDEFRRWIRSLVYLSSALPLFGLLRPDFFYLNFNYTEFAESLYHIPEMNICYIHGCRNKRTPLVFGHAADADTSCSDDPDDEFSLIPSSYSEAKAQILYDAQEVCGDYISEALFRLVKWSDKAIQRHCCFFNAQKYTEDVIIIGHSLSEVDMPYFTRLRTFFERPAEICWYISYHSEDDLKRIEVFKKEMGLEDTQVHLLNL